MRTRKVIPNGLMHWEGVIDPAVSIMYRGQRIEPFALSQSRRLDDEIYAAAHKHLMRERRVWCVFSKAQVNAAFPARYPSLWQRGQSQRLPKELVMPATEECPVKALNGSTRSGFLITFLVHKKRCYGLPIQPAVIPMRPWQRVGVEICRLGTEDTDAGTFVHIEWLERELRTIIRLTTDGRVLRMVGDADLDAQTATLLHEFGYTNGISRPQDNKTARRGSLAVDTVSRCGLACS
jgi:hypothetical protein